MSKNDHNKNLSRSREKGKAARERAQAKRRERREGQVATTERKKRGIVPVPDKKFVKDKYAFLDETNSRLFDHLRETQPIGVSVEFLCRWMQQKLDVLEANTKIIARDPQTTTEEKAQMCEAITRAAERARMMAHWVSGEETLDQRKYRLANGMFLDDSDKDFLKELLLGKSSKDV